MTWSIYAIAEAQLQQKGCATYTYLQRSSEPYIRKPFLQFSETMLDSELPGVDNPAFLFGLNPAYPFLTGAGGFLQVFTHGLTGMRPNIDAFYLDPMLPPQLPDGIRIKGMKWQGAVFDVTIKLEYTTVTRRPARIKVTHAQKHVTVRVGGNTKPSHYQMEIGDSIVVPTRRPDIGHGPGDLALCKPVTSDSDWAPGNYPYAIVDGSFSTVWQPASPREASATIDLGGIHAVFRIVINWAAVPPSTFSLSAKHTTEAGFKQLSSRQQVKISAPYVEAEARIVRIRGGNITEVHLSEESRVRFLKLTVDGSYAMGGLGATVAAVQVFAAGDHNYHYRESYKTNFSIAIGDLSAVSIPLANKSD